MDWLCNGCLLCFDAGSNRLHKWLWTTGSNYAKHRRSDTIDSIHTRVDIEEKVKYSDQVRVSTLRTTSSSSMADDLSAIRWLTHRSPAYQNQRGCQQRVQNVRQPTTPVKLAENRQRFPWTMKLVVESKSNTETWSWYRQLNQQINLINEIPRITSNSSSSLHKNEPFKLVPAH